MANLNKISTEASYAPFYLELMVYAYVRYFYASFMFFLQRWAFPK